MSGKKIVKNKKALSTVVETVLLVLISVMAVILVSVVIIPMIKEKLETRAECFKLSGDVQSVYFSESSYTCNNQSASNTSLYIKVNNGDFELGGIRISVGNENEETSFEMINGTINTNVRIKGNGDGLMILPNKGGAKTYMVYGNFTRATISPMTKNGYTCEMTDEVKIGKC